METSLMPVDFSLSEERPAYVVRIWLPPSGPRGAWAVDDWYVTGAEDVLQVIEWAERSAAEGKFELFLPDKQCATLFYLLGDRPGAEHHVEVPLTRVN